MNKNTNAAKHPAQLLDYLIKAHELKNDAGLANKLESNAPLISKIRNGKLSIPHKMLIDMHFAFKESMKELMRRAGMHNKFDL